MPSFSDFAVILFLFFSVLGMGAVAAKHGEALAGKYNFWLTSILKGLQIWLVLYLWWN